MTIFFTPAACAASTTLKLPSHITSSASRGSAAQAVMRSVAMWITASIPALSSWTRFASRMSPSTSVTRGGSRTRFDIRQRASLKSSRMTMRSGEWSRSSRSIVVEPTRPQPPVTNIREPLISMSHRPMSLLRGQPIGRAGLPTATTPAARSQIRLLPRPSMAPAPRVTPFMTLEPLPM